MSTLTVPAFLDALKAQLEARAHIVGDTEVTVWTGPLSPDSPHPRKAIVFVRAEDNLEPSGLGPQTQTTQRESYTVEGTICGTSPLKGEAGVKAARDACLALLGELNQQLREDMTVNGTAQWARLATVDWDQGLDQDRGRLCLATFTIRVEARIHATLAGAWT